MSDKRKETGRWLKIWRTKYRLVLMHDKTFEVRASVKITALNGVLIFSSVFVVVLVLVFSLVIFTPLRNYVVGANEVEMSRQLKQNSETADSIMRILTAYELYFDNFQKRMRGDVDTLIAFSQISDTGFVQPVLDSASAIEMQLRQQIEQEDLYNLSTLDPGRSGKENFKSLYFFPPLKGTLTAGFDTKENHYGVDIVAKENTPVKACLSGTVIDAYWSVETGNVIVIQHDYGLISFYKHNSQLLKKTGSFVKAGDVISIIGNTGELTTGPHLHFELWYNKVPLDPIDYINFN